VEEDCLEVLTAAEAKSEPPSLDRWFEELEVLLRSLEPFPLSELLDELARGSPSSLLAMRVLSGAVEWGDLRPAPPALDQLLRSQLSGLRSAALHVLEALKQSPCDLTSTTPVLFEIIFNDSVQELRERAAALYFHIEAGKGYATPEEYEGAAQRMLEIAAAVPKSDVADDCLFWAARIADRGLD